MEFIVRISGVYEALIAYVTNTWNKDTTIETSQKLVALYEAYDRVVDYMTVSISVLLMFSDWKQNGLVSSLRNIILLITERWKNDEKKG